MNDSLFWKLVEAESELAESAYVEMLGGRLRKLDLSDLLAFQRHLHHFHISAYSTELWEAAHLVNGGCSDDGFDDFRSWLITRGEDSYDRVVSTPETLATLEPIYGEWSTLYHLAIHIYEDVAGAEFPVDLFAEEPEPGLSREPDFDDLETLGMRYPRLAKRAKQDDSE